MTNGMNMSSFGSKLRNFTNTLVNGDDEYMPYDYVEESENDEYIDDGYIFEADDEEEELIDDNYIIEDDYEDDIEADLRGILSFDKKATIHSIEVANFNDMAQDVLMYHVCEEIRRGATCIVDFTGANIELVGIWRTAIRMLEFSLGAHADFSDATRCIVCPANAISTVFVAGEDDRLSVYVPYLHKTFGLDDLNADLDALEEDEETHENIRRGDFRQAN